MVMPVLSCGRRSIQLVDRYRLVPSTSRIDFVITVRDPLHAPSEGLYRLFSLKTKTSVSRFDRRVFNLIVLLLFLSLEPSIPSTPAHCLTPKWTMHLAGSRTSRSGTVSEGHTAMSRTTSASLPQLMLMSHMERKTTNDLGVRRRAWAIPAKHHGDEPWICALVCYWRSSIESSGATFLRSPNGRRMTNTSHCTMFVSTLVIRATRHCTCRVVQKFDHCHKQAIWLDHARHYTTETATQCVVYHTGNQNLFFLNAECT